MEHIPEQLVELLFRLGQEWRSDIENGTPNNMDSPDALKAYEALGFYVEQGIILLKYDESERGSFSDRVEICSKRHLKTILNHVRLMKLNALVMNMKALDVGLPSARVTGNEIDRLQKYPSLFPDETSRNSFWESIASEKLGVIAGALAKCKGLFSGWEHERIMDDELEAEMWDRNKSREPDLHPWAQFLSNRAPGSGLDFSNQEGGCVQLLPFAGCRIMNSLKEEDVATARRIKNEGAKLGLSVDSSFIPGESKPPTFTAEGNHRAFRTDNKLIDNHVANEDNTPYSHAPLLLEQLNSAHELLSHRVPNRTADWNCASVVIHDRPMRTRPLANDNPK